jgi:hypothetical protein
MASGPSHGQSPRQAGDRSQARGPGRRLLRIGVVLGGKIVDERLIREPRDVTIGQSAKNTFPVPLEALPRTWTLFVQRNGRYALCFSEAMDGRISDGGAVDTLASLRGGKARKQGDAWVLSMSADARGKVVLGDMTLLFQFVDEPARQAPMPLPASVRGRFVDRIDPTLAIVLAISLLVHFSVGMYAYQRDRVVKKRTARVFSETFQRPTVAVADLSFDQPRVPAEATPAEAADDKPAQPSDEPRRQPSSKPRAERGRDEGSGGRSAERALQLQEEAIAFANNLLSDDFSERGIGGGASDRDPRNDLSEAIAAVRRSGARVEVGGGSGSRGTRGEASTEIGTGQGPQVEGPGETTTRTVEKVAEKVPQGRINVGESSTLDETTLRPNDVLRKIQTVYMNGLKRCHRDLLKRDPTAGGRVGLRFTVGETGRVVRVKAEGFDPGVDRCIESQAQQWRFGVPRDPDGDPTDASFRISLVLQPD